MNSKRNYNNKGGLMETPEAWKMQNRDKEQHNSTGLHSQDLESRHLASTP